MRPADARGVVWSAGCAREPGAERARGAAGGCGGVAAADLVLPSGTITALVGESGSGKSTVAWLLLGLAFPQAGTVRVNGIDLRTIASADWRSRIAWVPQTPFFFCGSIRDNLTIGLTAVDDEAICSALEFAAALTFVERLPDGLDCLLGDRGAGLSGGELRRLALARVFLRGADLIILDEPTAGLDGESELLVCESLKRLSLGRTVLIISHRDDTVGFADRVVRLLGNPAETSAMARKGRTIIEERNSWQREMEKVEQLYEELARSGTGTRRK